MTWLLILLGVYAAAVSVLAWKAVCDCADYHARQLAHDHELQEQRRTAEYERHRRQLAESKCAGMVELFAAAGVEVPR